MWRGGGGLPLLSRSAFRETHVHVDKQKCHRYKVVKRMTSHYLLPAVMSNLRHVSKFSPTCCKVYKINRLGACCFNKPVTCFSLKVAAISVTTCYVKSGAHNTVSDLFERHCYEADTFI